MVHGEVQGVSFRDATARRARSREVGGFVRNCPDGTVEAVFEGPDDAVEALVAWVGEGPSGARVERVEVEALEGGGESGRDFEIR